MLIIYLQICEVNHEHYKSSANPNIFLKCDFHLHITIIRSYTLVTRHISLEIRRNIYVSAIYKPIHIRLLTFMESST